MKGKSRVIFKNGTIWKGTILEDGIETGYDTRGGAWSLYKIYDTDTPAVFVRFRHYGKRRTVTINKNGIAEIKEGWNAKKAVRNRRL